MIDWHSHILPAMDDGSRDVAESISIMEAQASQGVDTVIATPHFYANDESVEDFVNRRNAALAILQAQLPEGAPKILPGAEVRYYQGISHMEDLKALRIEGSKLLLLEMPMSVWTEYMVRELIELSGKRSIQIVLAHVERYFRWQKPTVWNRLLESGILMQANTTFFTTLATKRRALSLLQEGAIHLIGSDCHNLTSRPPQLGKAFELIQRKLGDDYIRQINEFGTALLGKTNVE